MSTTKTSNHQPKALSDTQLEDIARIFNALSEPSRLRLLNQLMFGPATVGGLVAVTGLGQANVSRHLGVLHQCGLVERERDGTTVIYQLCGTLCGSLCELVCGKMEEDARARYSALDS